VAGGKARVSVQYFGGISPLTFTLIFSHAVTSPVQSFTVGAPLASNSPPYRISTAPAVFEVQLDALAVDAKDVNLQVTATDGLGGNGHNSVNTTFDVYAP
jgi:hypothetical protein